FHVLSWNTISLNTILLDLVLLPLIMAGAWAGILLVRLFSDRSYRWFIIVMTLIAAIRMLITE
ncbi:MAG: sulfite exporter TauE/SafE family protein, partial [Cyclobacteriaceae bacterium]